HGRVAAVHCGGAAAAVIANDHPSATPAAGVPAPLDPVVAAAPGLPVPGGVHIARALTDPVAVVPHPPATAPTPAAVDPHIARPLLDDHGTRRRGRLSNDVGFAAADTPCQGQRQGPYHGHQHDPTDRTLLGLHAS